MSIRRTLLVGSVLLLSVGWLLPPGSPDESGERGSPAFRVTLSDSALEAMEGMGLQLPVKGRLFVIATRDDSREPRLQTGLRGVPFWGMDVGGLTGGSVVEMVEGDPAIRGYPLAGLEELPPGEYLIQAYLNVYTTFHRADGHVVEMHLNSGAGQSLWRAPGNAYSEPVRVRIDPQGDETQTVHLTLERVIAPIEPLETGESLQQGNPRDRGELVRFVKIRSEEVSEFWGHDMYIGANILLPADYWENPNRRYPVLYMQGHFPGRGAPFGYSDEGSGSRGRSAGLSELWRSPQAPGIIVVSIRDANPFYDTSYSLNSANVGPYGDAITQELIPYIEEHFRAIPEGWARLLAGGSTGGWEALAMQVFYPEFFGGSWGWCPDPVDFHYYQIVNVYEDDNAYERGTEWVKVERPNARRPDGNIVSTIRQENYYEFAAGPNSRSGGQWAIWEALFGPVGSDGYPAPIWDPVSGAIDREVAEYWRMHYDLVDILGRQWPTLGPSLTGKIHVTVGDMDSYYLNDAVYLMEEMFSTLTDPSPDATFEYGRGKPHCWIGSSPWRAGEDLNNAEYVQVLGEYLRERAPSRW